MANNKNQALVTKKETIDIVMQRVKEFQNSGELKFPANYIPENALKSAWLQVQEVQDKNYKPALEVCTRNSVANALLKMVVQGLNPDKNQCYFIAYGKKLLLQRSYFGSMHVAKTVDPNIVDIYAQTVYEDDEFEYEIRHGKAIVTLHKQKLSNIHKDKIIAAYATILYKDGRELSTIMTIDEIKQAWAQSPMKPVDDKGKIKVGGTHDKFMADMAEKTVINKACKYVINSSDDSSIVARYAKQADIDFAEAEVEDEIDENANQELIDIEEDETIEVEGVVHDEEEMATVDVEQEKEEKPAPKQASRATGKQKNQDKEQPKNLIDMAEEKLPY